MAEIVESTSYTPFRSFVARGPSFVPDLFVDVPSPRKSAIDEVYRLLDEVRNSHYPRVLPILGSAGYGKTALFQVLKQREELINAHVVYIPTPQTEINAEKLFSHMYFQVISQLGIKILNETITNIKRKFGTLETAIQKFVGKDGLVAEMFFALTDEKFNKTAKFLLSGLKLENPILPQPGNLMEDEELCFSALKVIAEYASRPIIYFFDEIEGLFVAYGNQPEMRLLERIKRVFNEHSNVLIIVACLTQIWEKILEVSTISTVSRFETPTLLKRFTRQDLIELAGQELKLFFSRNTSYSKSRHGSSRIWPFEEEDITEILEQSSGNPRDAIKGLYTRLGDKKSLLDDQTVLAIEIDAKWSKALKENLQSSLKKYSIGSIVGHLGSQLSLKNDKHHFLVYIAFKIDPAVIAKQAILDQASDLQVVILSDNDAGSYHFPEGTRITTITADPENTKPKEFERVTQEICAIIEKNS